MKNKPPFDAMVAAVTASQDTDPFASGTSCRTQSHSARASGPRLPRLLDGSSEQVAALVPDRRLPDPCRRPDQEPVASTWSMT